MVYRVVFHAKRQSNVMHALSVERAVQGAEGKRPNTQSTAGECSLTLNTENHRFIAVTHINATF